MQRTIRHEEFQPSPLLPLIKALIAKDYVLFGKLSSLEPHEFWREWKKVHPEDFPLDGLSPPDASSVVPRT